MNTEKRLLDEITRLREALSRIKDSCPHPDYPLAKWKIASGYNAAYLIARDALEKSINPEDGTRD